MDPLNLATVWFGGCSGCHMSFLDLDEHLFDLVQRVKIVFGPLVDVKEYPESVDVVLIEGAVCNEEHVELARKIRARTKILVALGDCAATGNVPAMRNQFGPGNAEQVLHRAYVELAELNQRVPKLSGALPVLLDRVTPVHEIVHVDYYLPGCPPPADRIRSFLSQLLDGQTPKLEGEDVKFG